MRQWKGAGRKSIGLLLMAVLAAGCYSFDAEKDAKDFFAPGSTAADFQQTISAVSGSAQRFAMQKKEAPTGAQKKQGESGSESSEFYFTQLSGLQIANIESASVQFDVNAKGQPDTLRLVFQTNEDQPDANLCKALEKAAAPYFARVDGLDPNLLEEGTDQFEHDGFAPVSVSQGAYTLSIAFSRLDGETENGEQCASAYEFELIRTDE